MCKYSAKRKHTLSQHIKAVHFREKIPCQMCDYQATRKTSLLRHVKNVHQTSESINCTECNKSVKTWSMRSHMKLHAKQQTQHTCKVCPYTTIHSYYNLKCHIERVHMNL